MKSITLVLVLLMAVPSQDFRSDQKKYPRVRRAYFDKENEVSELLRQHRLLSSPLQIFIRAFKKEEVVELWAKNEGDSKYTLIKTYPFCTSSGTLGPKRKEGDYQIPEGFYYIDRFNPASNFHLSLGLNYPNKSDKILGHSTRPGGDIFIHGDCVTIGCIPITDDKIKELYVFAVEAKTSGQSKIPVHIFPSKLGEASFKDLKNEYDGDPELLQFWENLKEGFEYFESNRALPKVAIDTRGRYQFN